MSRTCIALSSSSFYFSFTLFDVWDKELDELSALATFSFVGYVNNKVSESKNGLLYFTG